MDGLKGVVAALVSSLFATILLAYVYRISIPFGGDFGPFGSVSPYGMDIADVIIRVIFSWVFQGLMGGFIVLPVSGALTGGIIGQKYPEAKHKNLMIVLWASVISAIILALIQLLLG